MENLQNPVLESSESVSPVPQTPVVLNNTPINHELSDPESSEGLSIAPSIPGISCGLATETISSPDGDVPVVVLRDGAYENIDTSFMNNVPLQETGYCWATCTTDLQGDVMKITPEFNDRTKYLMNMYQDVCFNMIFKLICKMPLLCDQKFWVEYIPDGGGPLTQGVGFEWSPKDNNEVYVMVPWYNIYRTINSTKPASSGVSNIRVVALSDLVSQSGEYDHVNVDAYSCPSGMRLYNPKVVKIQDCPGPWCAEIITAPPGAPMKFQYETTGPYTVAVHVALPDANISLISDHDPTYTFVLAKNGQTVQCFTTAEPGWRSGTIEVSAGSSILVTVLGKFTYALVPQFVRNRSYLWDRARREYSTLNLPTMGDASDDDDVSYEQIDKFAYDPDNDLGARDVGLGNSMSKREQVHQQKYTTIKIPEDNEIADIKFEFSKILDTPSGALLNRHYLYSNTINVKLKAVSMPQQCVKLRVVQVYDNETYSKDQLLQLPGFDWDIKDSERNIRLCWNALNAVQMVTADKNFGRLCIFSLNGNRAATVTSGEIVAFINTSPLSYGQYRSPIVTPAKKKILYRRAVPHTVDLTPSVEQIDPTAIDVAGKSASYDESIDRQGQHLLRPEDSSTAEEARNWQLIYAGPMKLGDYPTTGTRIEYVYTAPLDRSFLGYLAMPNIRKYTRYRNTPTLKIVVNSSVNLNGQIAFCATSREDKVPTSPQDIARLYPGNVAGFNSTSYMKVPWLTDTPYLYTSDLTTTPDAGTCFGRLTFGSYNWTGNSTDFSVPTVYIYADISEMEFTIPRVYENDMAYEPPIFEEIETKTTKV